MKNVTKLLAKVMLLAILATVAFNFAGCEWMNGLMVATAEDIDGGEGSIVLDGWRSNNFDELNTWVVKNIPSQYIFLTFNFDSIENFIIDPYEINFKAKLVGVDERVYIWDRTTIKGKAEINNFEENSRLIVEFVSAMPCTYEGVSIFENTNLEIIKLSDKVKNYEAGYIMYYGVYVDGIKMMDFSIYSPSQKLSDEDFLRISDKLKDYIVVIN